MTKDEMWCAYLAGLFDGEGAVFIDFNVKEGKYLNVKLVVGFGFAHREEIVELLKQLHKEFGGTLKVYKKRDRGKVRDIVQWSCTDLDKVEAFIRSIYPHLRIKKKHAELALKAVKLLKSHYGSSAPRSPEILLELAKISDELSKLNRSKGRRKWTHEEVKRFIEKHGDVYVSSSRSWLSRERVLQILELRRQGLSYSKIASRVGVSKSSVARVVKVAEGRYKGKDKCQNIKAVLGELNIVY